MVFIGYLSSPTSENPVLPVDPSSLVQKHIDQVFFENKIVNIVILRKNITMAENCKTRASTNNLSQWFGAEN